MLHFGSVCLVDSPAKRAHYKAVSMAKGKKIPVSFDPNLRLPLWGSTDACIQAIHEFLPMADIVKASDDELEFLFGTDKPEKAAEKLFAMGCRLFLYTQGKNGAQAFTPREHVSIPGFLVPVVDTTGAGDSFTGAMLYQLAAERIEPGQLETLERYKLEELLRFASLYGACTTTRRGGVSAMATMAEMREFSRRFCI